MITLEGWIWLLGALAVVALAGYLANVWRQGARRRARQAYYARAANDSRPQQLASQPAPLSAGITPEQSEAIRKHAEEAAAKDWTAGKVASFNPYELGTQEYVLWYATYQLRMGELAEAAEDDNGREPERKKGP